VEYFDRRGHEVVGVDNNMRMPIPVCWRDASIRADASVTQNDES
jgi:hypothetical protein